MEVFVIRQARPLGFLHVRAVNCERPLTTDERATLALANAALREADAVVVLLGGKAGRLGEPLVATALLEGVLAALRIIGRAGVPVAIWVDAGVFELFQARRYRKRWRQCITCHSIAEDQRAQPPEHFALGMPEQRPLIIDLHGEHDGEPQLRLTEQPMPATPNEPMTCRRITTLANVARLCVRSYAARGPLRRYADAVGDLFDLPAGSVGGEVAQPRVLLAPACLDNEKRAATLLSAHGVAATDILIVCFFQSVVAAKVYERWGAVMLALCAWAHKRLPGRQLHFLVACGDDELHPNGPTQADLALAFADFTGAEGNATVTVTRIPLLRNLALVLRQAALTLSNDTGPGHLSGALSIPTVTPYLPGHVYSRQVWASTLAHRGVTLDPSPFTHREVEAAVLWNRPDVINAIPPEWLANEAIACLDERLMQ